MAPESSVDPVPSNENKQAAPWRLALWGRSRIFLQIGVPLLVLALVWYEIRELNIHLVRQALVTADRDLIGAGIFLAFMAIGAMGFYDALAFPSGADGRLKFGRRWFIGSLLFAWTNFVSIGPIGGPALRILVYRKFGLKGSEITRGLVVHFIGMAGGLTGWLVSVWIPLPGTLNHLGFRVAAAAAGSVALTNIIGRVIAAWLNRFPGQSKWDKTPLSRLGIVSFFDWGLTLISFFLFIRSVGVAVHFSEAARTVLTGQFAGVISMIPGGLGSADAVWLKGFKMLSVDVGAAAAAIVVFRAGFYLVPWMFALVVLYLLAVSRSEQLRLWQRRIVGGAVLVNGVLLLLSAATPDLRERLAILEKIVPLGVVEASHLMATLSAAAMLFLVRGLWRGYRGAYVMTMALFAASALANPLKGGDYEEAVISVILILLLFGARKAFKRQGRIPLGWELALAVGVASLGLYLVVGIAAIEKFSMNQDAWMIFDYNAHANRFLRAGILLGVVAIILVIRQSLRPVSEWITPTREDMDRAEAFCRQNADSADALQVGGGDKAVWFWEPVEGTVEGVILYQRFNGKIFVYKDPIIAPKSDPIRLLEDFFRYTEILDIDVVFSMITGRWMEHLHNFGYHFVKVTKEAIVSLEGYSLQGGKNAGMRRIMRSVERAQINYTIMEPPFSQETVDQLRAVSDAWLASKGGHEMQFSPCYFSPEYIQRNPVAVARDASGRIIAFLNILITHPGGSATFDFIRYLPDHIDNVMDFVIVRTMESMAKLGYASFSLGGAPMGDVGTHRRARLMERMMRLFSLRAERLFNFQGLLRFKSKFHPQWTPRYLAYPKPWDGASALLANARLVQAGGREARNRIAAARLGRTP